MYVDSDSTMQIQTQTPELEPSAQDWQEPAQAAAGAPQEQAEEQAQAPAEETTQEQAPRQEPEERQEQAPATEASQAERPEPAQPQKRGRGRPKKVAPPPSDYDILEELAAAFPEAGLERPDGYGRDMADGRWHRCRGEGQTGSLASGCGAYILHWEDPRRPVLVAYRYAGAITAWRAYRQAGMTQTERRQLKLAVKAWRDEHLRQVKEEADKAALRAQEEWDKLHPLESVCGYLAAKSLSDVYGLRGTEDRIAVPLRNAEGELRALQTISRTADSGGFEKRFTAGCRMPGLYFEFPEEDGASGPICVGEGLATVGTVVDVMGWHGVAAMDCGNLDAVVGAVRRLYPDRQLIVLADNDAFWPGDAGGPRPHRKGEKRPEQDNVGVVKAREAAQKYGVKVAICPIAGDKCTDFNDLYVRSGGGEAGAEAVRTALEAARHVPGCPCPAGYVLLTDEHPGLYAEKPTKAGPETIRLGPPLLVEGHVRGTDGRGWGILVSWQDPDGGEHRSCLSRADLASRDRIWLNTLVDGGYQADTGHAGELLRYLELCSPARRFLAPTRTGWLDDRLESFVLPGRIVGTPAGVDPADIAYAGGATSMYRHAGTLEEWQQNVAALAVGNPKMVFCLCAAFAGPLLHVIGAKNNGFHLVGPSSTGKTTHLHLANSVWDSYDSMGTWKATDNGKEAEAAFRNDTLICLDEINEANSKTIGSVVYMLGNGQGKTRSKKDGGLREQKKFRLVFFSSGEVSLESIITSAGGQHQAGMDVRAVPVPLDKSDVRDVHGHGSPRGLCDAVQAGTRRHFGTAGPAFVERLLPVLRDADSNLRPLLRREFLQRISADLVRGAGYDMDATDPQIQRISESFAIVCVAGILAAEFGVLPKSINIRDACINVFRECVEFRGGTSSQEELKIVEATTTFLFSNSNSMFNCVDNNGNITENAISRPIAGFKKYVDDVLYYYVLPKIMHDVWKGVAVNKALQVLEDKGFIVTYPSVHGRRHYQQYVTVPGDGTRLWMYCMTIPDADDAPESAAYGRV